MGVSLLIRLIDGQRVDALRMELVDEADRPRVDGAAAPLIVRAALIAALVLVGVFGAALVAATLPRSKPRATQSTGSSPTSGRARRNRDRSLVNAWGLAASPTGPWWTANEASDTSTLYSGGGPQAAPDGARRRRPDRLVFYGGKGFPVSGRRAARIRRASSTPARTA